MFGLEEEERMIGEKIKLIVYNIVANKRSTNYGFIDSSRRNGLKIRWS